MKTILATKMSYGNGETISYEYDKYGRKTKTSGSDGRSFTYSYSGDGQLAGLRDSLANRVYGYTYDTLGRMIGSSMKLGETVALQTQHKYDESNRLSKQS